MLINPGDRFSLEISETENGERLDSIIAERLENVSRSRISSLIKTGLILIDDMIKKPGYHVREGEVITGFLPFPSEYSCGPEDIFFETLYEDHDIIVINKPAGLVVHPSPGHESGTLVNALLAKCPDLQGIGEELRPGIVHRLDKDTSGLMIAAKNQSAHTALVDMFKTRSVEKKYLAIVAGVPNDGYGIIEMPVGRHPVDRKKMSVASKKVKDALSIWKIRERFYNAALLEVEIKTGRTHQIRVHLDYIGYPVAGDQVYGDKKNALLKKNIGASVYPKRQMLHSWSLLFPHPATGITMNFQAQIPDDMDLFLAALK